MGIFQWLFLHVFDTPVSGVKWMSLSMRVIESFTQLSSKCWFIQEWNKWLAKLEMILENHYMTQIVNILNWAYCSYEWIIESTVV